MDEFFVEDNMRHHFKKLRENANLKVSYIFGSLKRRNIMTISIFYKEKIDIKMEKKDQFGTKCRI